MHTLARLLVPGYRQLAAGRPRRAIAVASAAYALLLLALFTSWLHAPAGLATFLVALTAVAVWAWQDGRRLETRATVPPRTCVLLAAPFWLLLLSLAFEPMRVHVVGLQAFHIPPGNRACAPALLGGDRFLVDTRDRAPRRGEIVVFRAPDDPGRVYVKRVVALAGDVVRAEAGGIRVNGKPVLAGNAGAFGPLTVPPGRCFLVGDNLADSRDSRAFGPVEIGAILGRVLYVFWAERWDRIGTTPR